MGRDVVRGYRDTLFARNHLDPKVMVSDSHHGGIFSHGGQDSGAQPFTTQRLASAEESRPRQNIVPRSNALANTGSWARSGVSIAQDVTGPDAVANSAYTLTRTGSGYGRLSQTLTAGWTADEPLVMSWWAKAGTTDLMSVEMIATDVGSGVQQQLVNNFRPIRLSPWWERLLS